MRESDGGPPLLTAGPLPDPPHPKCEAEVPVGEILRQTAGIPIQCAFIFQWPNGISFRSQCSLNRKTTLFFRLAIVPVQREVESGCSLAASRASLDDTAPMYWLVRKARC